MSNSLAGSGGFINSIIGEGTRFRGNLELTGLLRVDGDFSGAIKAQGKVLIGKTGRVESTIIADAVVIGGIVKGNIQAREKVVILPSGIFLGNVKTPRMVADIDMVMNGNCLIGAADNDDLADEKEISA